MALEDTSAIDLIAKPNAEGKVCLIITDAGLTNDPEARFDLLTKKLQAYVRAVLGGELEMDYPEKPPGDFFIRVVCAHPPTEAMRQITSVGEFDGQIPVRFETWQPDDESDAPPPVTGETPPVIAQTLRSPATPPPLPAAARPQRAGWLWVVAGLVLAGLVIAVGVGIWFVRAAHDAAQLEAAAEVPGTNTSSPALNPGLASAPAAVNDDLAIISAEFGVPGRRADVKARLAELLRTRPEGFEIISKSFQHDPAPFKKKNLTILYRYQGVDYALNLPGGGRMSTQTLVKHATK